MNIYSIKEKFRFTSLFSLLVCLAFSFQLNAQTVIISQYVETSSGSSPKGIELWNPSDVDIDLAATPITIYQGTNGGSLQLRTTIDSGTLAAGSVIVVGTADMSSTCSGCYYSYNFQFNGDDALQIRLNDVVTDVFGTVGEDPGTNWNGNGVSTRNQNIQLIEGITTGDTDGWTDPSERFETVPVDDSGSQLVGFGVAPVVEDEEEPLVNCTTPDFEVSTITSNSSNNNGGAWEVDAGTYTVNGYCGGGCEEEVNSWLIYGPINTQNVSQLQLSGMFTEQYGLSTLNFAYSTDLGAANCPENASWTSVGEIVDDVFATSTSTPEAFTMDFDGVNADTMYIGIQYSDDGTDGFTEFVLSELTLSADECPTASNAPSSDLSAGMDTVMCGLADVELSAEGAEGTWSGGAGTFSAVNDPNATYTPDASELGQTVVLTYTVEFGVCTLTDEVSLTFIEEAGDAEFYYAVDTICPGDGQLFTMHTTGVDGYYSVTNGDAEGIDLNPQTGAINVGNTEDGTYTITNTVSACGNLLISAIFDGPLSGGVPKGVELYALNDISDLSRYALGSANNGGGTDGQEFTFPAETLAKGEYIYVATEIQKFEAFFGFPPNYTSSAMAVNGNDAVELFCDGMLIDVFGEQTFSGFIDWFYRDGWAYRVNDSAPNYGSFELDQFTYSGADVLDGAGTNAAASLPVPIATFTTSYEGVCPINTHSFDITIGDYEDPVFTCPSDQTISLDAGECGTFAEIFDIEIFDNCSPDIDFVQISGPVQNDFLSKENSPYTVVFEATDAYGVVTTCSYDIYVEEYQNPTSNLACNGSINVSVDDDCSALITADMVLEGGPYGCYDDYILSAELDGASVGNSIDAPNGTGNYLRFDGTYAGQKIEVSVKDPDSGNICWGYVVIEDKLAPSVICESYEIECNEDINAYLPQISDNCSEVSYSFTDEVLEGGCNDDFYKKIFRTWEVTDASGNEGNSCTQEFTIPRESIDSLKMPLNYDGLAGNYDMLSCDGAGSVWNTNDEGYPSPYPKNNLIGTGVPGGLLGCNKIDITYEDTKLDICTASYKVLREWTIVDWCTSKVIKHTQIIKVMDTQGPTLPEFEDVEIVATAHCGVDYKFPFVSTSDNCSSEPNYVYRINGNVLSNNAWVADNILLNTPYVVEVVATDDCGNETIKTFNAILKDKTPPVVVGETKLSVSLSADGVAKIYATSFDDGSHDGCNGVGFAVARMGSSCASMDKYPPNGDDNFQFNEIVHFCCADIGNTNMVIFRVCDDAGNDGEYGNDTDDNCNESMVEVVVQDKLAPEISCPDNMTISCVDVAGIDWENYELVDGLFGKPVASATCEITNPVRSTAVNLDCPDPNSDILGFVVRSFTVTTESGTATCTQKITVESEAENSLTCDRISLDLDAAIFAEAGITGKNLRQFGYDNPTQADPYKGFDSHWCAYNGYESFQDPVDGNLPLSDKIPSFMVGCDAGFAYPEVLVNIDGLCTEAGTKVTVTDTFNFAGGACKKYLVHYEVIDNCVFDENFVNPTTGEIDPYHSLNGYFELYIEINAFDNEGPELDCTEVKVAATSCTGANETITIGGTDNCSTDNSIWGYQWRVDVNADNTIDYPANGWYNGREATAAQLGLAELPVGKHIFYWVVADGCGNTSTCAQEVTITPNEKQPTPYCHTGIVTTPMTTGMVEVWADEFNIGSFDNCTPKEDLVFSFSQDTTEKSKVFTCENLGFNSVEMWVTDSDGNQDYCTVTILLQDTGNCDQSGTITVEGEVSSSYGYMNSGTELNVSDGTSSYMAAKTENGKYDFNIGNISEQTSVTPYDNSNVVMGVTTLDIILIQKHILGLEKLQDPEALIAADANNSGTISGTDIVQLRKLILGLITELPNNDSWNFYPSNVDLNNVQNVYDVNNYIMLGQATEFDFTSVKIGDVNHSSSSQFANNDVDTRTLNEVIFYEEAKNDDKYAYTFSFEESTDLEGLQLVIDGIDSNTELLSLQNAITEHNFVMRDGSLFLSINDLAKGQQELFTLTSNEPLTLKLAKDVVNELYVATSSTVIAKNAELREKSDSQAEGFNAYVSPNPFGGQTVVTLTGELDKEAYYTIYSAEGKVVVKSPVVSSDIVVRSADLLGTGVYFLKVSNGTETITKKLINIK